MQIVHLIESDTINHITRYVDEFVKFDNDSKVIAIKDSITPNDIIEINKCDCLLIHYLPHNKQIYQKIIKNVKIIKVLFLHQYTLNELYKVFDKNYIKQLLRNCFKICLYKDSATIYKELLKYNINENKIIKTDLVYNFNNYIQRNTQLNNIIFINHNSHSTQLNDSYIKLYNYYKQYINGIYNIYGISKNITTFNIINSELTNVVIGNNVDIDKLNLYDNVSYDIFLNIINSALFVCDLSEHFTYGILDTINNGTIIILNNKLLKQYNISNILSEKSSINDINNYIDKYKFNTNMLLMNFNELFNIENTISDLKTKILQSY